MDFARIRTHRSRVTSAHSLLALLAALVCCSCSKSPATPDPSAEAPAKVVNEFIAALRAGNENQAASLLTDIAQQKRRQSDKELDLKMSSKSQFMVVGVEYRGDLASVKSAVSDIDQAGVMRSKEIEWSLRKTSDGYRIRSLAAKVLADKPPMEMDFEDPEASMAKQRWLEEEDARRKQEEDEIRRAAQQWSEDLFR